jgi:hypothetical protein
MALAKAHRTMRLGSKQFTAKRIRALFPTTVISQHANSLVRIEAIERTRELDATDAKRNNKPRSSIFLACVKLVWREDLRFGGRKKVFSLDLGILPRASYR